MAGLAPSLASRAKRWGKPPVTATLLAAGYYRRRRLELRPGRAVILLYHHVTGGREGTDIWWAPFQRGVAAERFDRQMRYLRRAMTPVSLHDVVDFARGGKSLPPRAVAVTFDDGYLDNFTVAYPVLRKHAIPATVFVSTGFIETPRAFWWDEVYWMLRATPLRVLEGHRLGAPAGIRDVPQGEYRLTTRGSRVRAAEAAIDMLRGLPDVERRAGLVGLRSALGLPADAARGASPMMSWDQLRELSRNGITIESHTHTHPILGRSSPEAVEVELSTSRRLIEERLGQAVQGLAYPDGGPGTYDEAIKRITERVGYRFACATVPGTVRPGDDPFSLGRIPLDNTSFPVFVRDLLQAYAAG